MSLVAKLSGQILGQANGPSIAPYTNVTITPTGPGFTDPITLITLSPSLLSQWSVGSTITMYIAIAPADVSAIEAAVTVIGIDSQT